VAAPQVAVIGLKELRRDLLRVDKDYFPKAFQEAGVRVATPVADTIRSALPNVSGDLSGSVRVTKIRTGATIRVGTKSIPYAGPVEFGGYPESVPYVSTGRYIFPAATGLAAKAGEEYGKEVQKAIDHYPWEQPKA
jgi:hypothetical protein